MKNISSQSLADYNFVSPNFSFKLEKNLKEISGLTLTDSQRLFAHDDEVGTIYELNPINGKIIKEFYLGNKKIKDDFEDIAFVNGKFYLLNSKGDFWIFEEGMNKQKVDFENISTGLKSKFDTEGLCFDKELNSLLIASKESVKKNNFKYIFKFDLLDHKIDENPFIKIDLSKITVGKKKEEFKPSAIIKNKNKNTYFVLGGKSLAIIEVTGDSKIINQIELDNKFHNQPEGMVILESGEILISDEAEKKYSRLTSYKLKKDD